LACVLKVFVDCAYMIMGEDTFSTICNSVNDVFC